MLSLSKLFRHFKLIPPLETYPKFVQFSQTVCGKLCLLGLFCIGLIACDFSWWPFMLVILGGLSFLPQYRHVIVVIATFSWLSQYADFETEHLHVAAAALNISDEINWYTIIPSSFINVILFCALFYYFASRFKGKLLMRYPIATLLSLYLLLLWVASSVAMEPVIRLYLWGFLLLLGRYIWFLAYSLKNLSAPEQTHFFYQLGTYVPYWNPVSTSVLPFPKGIGYLNKIEAKSAHELAISQIKGVKLLYWAFLLMITHTLYMAIIYGDNAELSGHLVVPFSFGFPNAKETITAAVSGAAMPWHTAWASLYLDLIRKVLEVAIWGHVIIACVRMSGYNALRATYNPLLAKNLTEFWNRYLYYFKELLVEFFFYPSFLRFFKRQPRLRLFFATLMAAGFGNVLFHLIKDIEYFITLGFWGAIISFQTYFFYGLLLGCALGISQLRQRQNRTRRRHWFAEHILSRYWVYTFYCVVLIFDDPDRQLSLWDHVIFIFSLFNVTIS